MSFQLKVVLINRKRMFFQRVFGGMVIRFFTTLIMVVLALLFLELNRISFIFSILFFYIFYLVIRDHLPKLSSKLSKFQCFLVLILPKRLFKILLNNLAVGEIGFCIMLWMEITLILNLSGKYIFRIFNY